MFRIARMRFEAEIKRPIDDLSRIREHVEGRCALSNALRPFGNLEWVGSIFGKDHSTVCHYLREHDAMLQFYPTYAHKFTIAMRIVDEVAEEMGLLPMHKTTESGINHQIQLYTQTIVELQRRVKKLQSLAEVEEKE